MEHWVDRGPLRVDPSIARWIEREAGQAARMETPEIWECCSVLAARYNGRIAHLIAERSERQAAVDAWHAALPRRAEEDRDGWIAHLERIGWLLPRPASPVQASLDLPTELKGGTGPHLVVALSDEAAVQQALTGRWADLETSAHRREQPLAATALLDRVAPLASLSWAQVVRIEGSPQGLVAGSAATLRPLVSPGQWEGMTRDGAALLRVDGQRLRVFARGWGHAPAVRADIEVAPSIRLELEGWAVLSDPKARSEAWGRMMAALGSAARGAAGQSAFGADDAPVVSLGLSGLCDTMALAEDGSGRLVAPMIFDMFTAACAARAAGPAPRVPLVLCLPELDGPEEVALAAEMAETLEGLLSLPRGMLLLGLTALRRRAEVNIGACIAAARGRMAHLGLGGAAALSDALRLHREAGPLPPPDSLAMEPWAEATEQGRQSAARSAGLIGKVHVAGRGPGLSPLARTREEAADAALSALSLERSSGERVSVGAARNGQGAQSVPAASMLGPVLAGSGGSEASLAMAARRLLAHSAAWVGQGTGRAEVPGPDGVMRILCPARARAEALWLVNQLRHGAVAAEGVLRLLRREAAGLDALAVSAGRPAQFGPDCSAHSFQAACDLVFREGDWPVGDALAVLRERRAETLAHP